MNRLLIASLAVLAAALPASADTVLQKAKSMSKDGPLYAFDLSYDDGKDRFQMKVDPSQPKGKRVVDLSPARSTLKGDSAKKADKLTERTEGDIWCSSFAANIPADAKRTAETGQTATFSFTLAMVNGGTPMARFNSNNFGVRARPPCSEISPPPQSTTAASGHFHKFS